MPGGERVLVVEDQPRMRDLLVDVIPEMGFASAIAVRTAEDAIRAMAARPSEIVCLDLQLPGMGGMELLAEIRRCWPATQVIILSAFGTLEAATQAIRLDVVDFLRKPFHLCELEQALARARSRIEATRAPEPTPAKTDALRTLEQVERDEILQALERHNGNRTRAAMELGISRRTLHYRLKDYGLSR